MIKEKIFVYIITGNHDSDSTYFWKDFKLNPLIHIAITGNNNVVCYDYPTLDMVYKFYLMPYIKGYNSGHVEALAESFKPELPFRQDRKLCCNILFAHQMLRFNSDIKPCSIDDYNDTVVADPFNALNGNFCNGFDMSFFGHYHKCESRFIGQNSVYMSGQAITCDDQFNFDLGTGWLFEQADKMSKRHIQSIDFRLI